MTKASSVPTNNNATPNASSKNSFSQHSSRIQDVIIELDDYQFFHSPYTGEIPRDEKFIGRRKVIDRLKMILSNTETKSGAYLVAGFRGMGKTSIVRKAIHELNMESGDGSGDKKKCIGVPPYFYISYRKFLIFNYFLLFLFLALASWKLITGSWFWVFERPISLEIFHSIGYGENFSLIINLFHTLFYFLIVFIVWICFTGIISALIDREYCKNSKNRISTHQLRKSTFMKFEINLSQGEVTDKDVLRQLTKQLLEYWVSLNRNDNYLQYLIELAVRKIFFIPYKVYIKRCSTDEGANYNTILGKLIRLSNRMDAEVSLQQESSFSPSISKGIGWGLLSAKIPLMSLENKNQINFPIASVKEIENELITILKEINELRNQCDPLSGGTEYGIARVTHSTPIPELVFIIDELDKIEPLHTGVIQDREASDPSLDNQLDIVGVDKTRKRQETVARLLANLKSFLNVARAKFIFIGGREMYDASLADIADRDSFYSSIFHEIIYVSSFFKDKIELRTGVTRMTEAYICSLLIPKEFIYRRYSTVTRPYSSKNKIRFNHQKLHEHYNLSTLFNYLAECHAGISEKSLCWRINHRLDYQIDKFKDEKKWEKFKFNTNAIDKFGNQIAIQKTMKVIFLLQNLIIYLAYRSNGTPKKLIGLVEDYIVSVEKLNPILSFRSEQQNVSNDEINNWKKNSNYLVITHNYSDIGSVQNVIPKKRLFLRFNFNSQYEINFTANLYRPYLILQSRYLKSLGDKLLFSNPFMFDHLLKYHSFGFAWRNLEMIPEITLINKEPNLRRFVEELVKFLLNMYIRPSISGIFQYRFNTHIINEITFLSKISELSGAAFNFTLDESLMLKRHYKRKLKELEKKHSYYNKNTETHYVHSIGFIRTILGDLHFYDKEYDDAIIHYSDSIQQLRVSKKEIHIVKHQLLILIRNQLKLGLTLEKMRAFDSAFSIYRGMMLDLPIHLKDIVDLPDSRTGFSELSLLDGLKPYRGLQLLTKPYIAWLGVIEKQRWDGITYSNLKKCEAELNNMRGDADVKVNKKHILFDNRRINTLKSDFYHNVGGILFFKNKYFKEDFENRGIANFYMVEQLLMANKRDFSPSLNAYIYYLEALRKLLKVIIARTITEDEAKSGDATVFHNYLAKVSQIISSEKKWDVNSNYLYILANIVGKIGDCVLTFISNDDLLEFFEKFERKSNMINTPKKEEENQVDKPLLNYEVVFNLYELNEVDGNINEIAKQLENYFLERNFKNFSIGDVLIIYRLAGLLFLKSGRTYDYAFCYKKGLYMLKDYLSALRKEYGAKMFKVVETVKIILNKSEFERTIESIALRIIHATTWASDVANRPQILKYRDIFGNENKELFRPPIYNNISTSTETREIWLLVEEIKLKLKRLGFRIDSNFNIKGVQLTPYSSIQSKFTRMLELKFKCEINFYVLKDVLKIIYFKDKKKLDIKLPDDKKIQRLLKRTSVNSTVDGFDIDESNFKYFILHLVTDSIFCSHEVIKSLNIFGVNYVFNHSYLANAHYKLANWCEMYRNLIGEDNDLKKAGKVQMENLLGTGSLYYLEPNYHNELAIQSFYSALQTHQEGKAYKDNLNNMYFSEDDFNDNLRHFSAASERFRMNSGLIRSKIVELKKRMEESSVYDYKSHMDWDYDYLPD